MIPTWVTLCRPSLQAGFFVPNGREGKEGQQWNI